VMAANSFRKRTTRGQRLKLIFPIQILRIQ
jgi:hypothetical protein